MEQETEASYMRIVATFSIFVVSLLGEAQMTGVIVEPVTDWPLISAVSFPTLSKRISFLRIPRIIFFIGKHFGTGLFAIQNASTRV